MISRFFNKKVKVERLSLKGGEGEDKNTQEWKQISNDLYCHIQTWAEGEVGYEGSRFATHMLWCDISEDLKEGDRVIDGEQIYQVLKVENLGIGLNQHKQAGLSVIVSE